MLSVIVPVYNDPHGIAITLDSLVDQDEPKHEYEILVVDNGSTDNTVSVIDEIARENPRLVKSLTVDSVRNSYAARNHGISNAAGEYLAFIDADMRVPSTWVDALIDTVEETGWLYMGCAVKIELPATTLVANFDRVTGFPVEHFIETYHFAPTCSLVVHRDLFEELGRFDDRLISGGDIEFGRRVYEEGIEQHFSADIVLYHPARITIRENLARHWRVGRGIAQQARYHPTRCAGVHPPVYKLLLPPKPANFIDAIYEMDPGLRTSLAYYVLEYLEQLSRGAGRVYEGSRLLLTRTTRPAGITVTGGDDDVNERAKRTPVRERR